MYYTQQRIERICGDLSALIIKQRCIVGDIRWRKGFFRNPAEAGQGPWQTFSRGERWGGYDSHAWFQADIIIPDMMAGRKVLLDVSVDQENWSDNSRQFLLFVDGALRQGMDINHRAGVLYDEAPLGARCRIDLQAYAGLVDKQTELYLQLQEEDKAVKALYYDLYVPALVAAELPEGDKIKLDMLDVLNQAVNHLDLRKPYSELFYQSVQTTRDFLEERFYQAMCGRQNITATSVGHTHIDVAWLWTLAQTREKVARSFSTVLRLMEEHPEYIFMSSQPQLYQFLKQDYPEVYEKVKARVREGRWEAEGGMWLEADCNLASGESFIRQLIYGTRFFRDEFGVENHVLWLPDVFGYSAALPQILRLAGIDSFMTTKINWNQYNPIPADTFLWQGIDGSQVLTHFITTTSEYYNPTPHFSTYNGYLTPKAIMGGWKRYQEKQIHEDILVAYGYGDGGGGPTEDMLEQGKRMARGIPGCPKVVPGRAGDFFKRLDKTVKDSLWLKKWVGELYFEYHRGTYTSMARNKRYNRKAELLYQDAETLASLAALQVRDPYPAALLSQGWETILLNQFHDILPGSSIEPVYRDSAAQYEEVLKNGRQMANRSLGQIAGRIGLPGQAVVLANTAGFDRGDLVCLPWPEESALPVLFDPIQKTALPVQRTAGGLIFLSPAVPAKGYCCLPINPAETRPSVPDPAASESSLSADSRRLENRFWLIELDEQGNLSRILDKKQGRDILQPSRKGNVFRAFEDKPMAHQNWDIDIYYQQKSWSLDEAASIEVTENGPVRAGLKITRPFLDSVLIQTVYLYDQLPRIDFDTFIDWKENELLLKVEFPVDIHAETATYDIQFGNLTRPTHWNTSWDWARFEVCAHKWADLSEDGYGVSLMNDCKYGHDIRDGVMRLTLLKSGMSPNPHADREQHHLVYSLYPHAGDWRQARTMQQAYSLNIPLYAKIQAAEQKAAEEGALPDSFSLCRVDTDDHVMLETVKRAEEGDGLIFRLFEYCNRRGAVRLTLGCAPKAVEECDVLERTLRKLTVIGNTVDFDIKPYEIKSFRIIF